MYIGCYLSIHIGHIVVYENNPSTRDWTKWLSICVRTNRPRFPRGGLFQFGKYIREKLFNYYTR